MQELPPIHTILRPTLATSFGDYTRSLAGLVFSSIFFSASQRPRREDPQVLPASTYLWPALASPTD